MSRRRLDDLLVADAIAQRLRALDPGTVLDAGVGVGDLLGPRWPVTALGARDVRALPFADAGFDVAVAGGLLTRVPWADRPRALHQLARVARRWVVVAVPPEMGALDVVAPLRAWGVVRVEAPGEEPAAAAEWQARAVSVPVAAVLAAGLRRRSPRARALAQRLGPAYPTLVVAEIAASISASSSAASAS